MEKSLLDPVSMVEDMEAFLDWRQPHLLSTVSQCHHVLWISHYSGSDTFNRSVIGICILRFFHPL